MITKIKEIKKIKKINMACHGGLRAVGHCVADQAGGGRLAAVEDQLTTLTAPSQPLTVSSFFASFAAFVVVP